MHATHSYEHVQHTTHLILHLCPLCYLVQPGGKEVLNFLKAYCALSSRYQSLWLLWSLEQSGVKLSVGPLNPVVLHRNREVGVILLGQSHKKVENMYSMSSLPTYRLEIAQARLWHQGSEFGSFVNF
jgi:hypothetical protein